MSAMQALPRESKADSEGPMSNASVAGPPSPRESSRCQSLAGPLPANVVMNPVAASTSNAVVEGPEMKMFP